MNIIEFNGLHDILNIYNNIIISAHVNPDGDAVASCTALSLILKKLGKNVIILLEDYGEKYKFLSNDVTIYNHITEIREFENELFISLDCGDKQRLGEFKDLFEKAKSTLNIDHHITNDKFADYNYVFDKSSTCEIIYELSLYLKSKLDDDIAKAIYTGIIYDTGGFRYQNTTARTHEIASELIKYKFSFTDIFKELFDFRSYNSTKLLGRALERIELLFNGLAITYLTLEDLEEFKSTAKDTGGIIDHLRNIKGVKTSIFIYENSKTQSKISMRSNEFIDILKIALKFGGGGHIKACGCTINENSNISKTIIINEIKNQLNLS